MIERLFASRLTTTRRVSSGVRAMVVERLAVASVAAATTPPLPKPTAWRRGLPTTRAPHTTATHVLVTIQRARGRYLTEPVSPWNNHRLMMVHSLKRHIRIGSLHDASPRFMLCPPLIGDLLSSARSENTP